MGHPQPLLSFIFGLFKQTLQFLQYMWKCPSSIRYQDSNPRPLGFESPPITTRPGLSPMLLSFPLLSPLYFTSSSTSSLCFKVTYYLICVSISLCFLSFYLHFFLSLFVCLYFPSLFLCITTPRFCFTLFFLSFFLSLSLSLPAVARSWHAYQCLDNFLIERFQRKRLFKIQ